MLLKLFSQARPNNNSSVIGTGNDVDKSIVPSAFPSQPVLSKFWIVDLGASAHKTENLGWFNSHSHTRLSTLSKLLMGLAPKCWVRGRY